jgi:ribose transport system permease protein
VPLAAIRTTTYAISGACAALSGVIITSQVGLAVPYQGTGYELDVIAAVVVGGVALTGGTGSVLVGALGSIFIGVLLNGMALINGVIITRLRINPFITTLAMLSVVRGVVYIISNQYNVNIPDGSGFLVLGRGHVGHVPISVLVFALLLAALSLMEQRTTIGRSIHALGGNQAAARLCAVPLAAIRTTTYAISGACAALAGVIITSQVGLAVPYQGTGYELDVIAAVVVGGVALTGGTGSVLVGALGSIFIGVLLNGMALINVPAIWQMVIQGAVIITAVALYGVARSRTA